MKQFQPGDRVRHTYASTGTVIRQHDNGVLELEGGVHWFAENCELVTTPEDAPLRIDTVITSEDLEEEKE